MRAIVFKEYGPPEVLKLEEVETPVPKDDEVLIRVRAATVAKADIEARSFTFPLWLRLPMRLMFGVFRPRIPILGQEIAGDIEEVGANASDFKQGERVFVAISGFGGHAEFITVPASSAIAEMPEGMPYEDGACLTVFALNALHFIRKSEIEEGDHVLINGAGGSIGTVAVQLARYFGARVVAVDSGDKLEMLRSIGADHVLDYECEDFTANVGAYDVVLDVAGTSPYGRSLRALKKGGRYVLANPRLMPMVRGFWTSAVSDKKVLFEFASYDEGDLAFLADLYAKGHLKPVIDRCFRMQDIVEAHRYVESGKKIGNVVITMD